MITICVDFEIDAATLDLFLPIMQKNATEPLANEVSCHQFDILKDPQSPIKIFLYELYDDAVASELHDQANHCLEFNQSSKQQDGNFGISPFSEKNQSLILGVVRQSQRLQK